MYKKIYFKLTIIIASQEEQQLQETGGNGHNFYLSRSWRPILEQKLQEKLVDI
jgi:hypothetical protein